jgi:hypothetical protein
MSLAVQHHPIADMTLPDGWYEDVESEEPAVGAYRRTFRSKETPSAEICIRFAGRRLSQAQSDAFLQLLDGEPHELSKSEYEEFWYVLGNLAYPELFQLQSAHVKELNGRSVLSVEGKWSDSYDMSVSFFPEDDLCTRVLELYYKAPSEYYQDLLTQATGAMQSLRWE